MTDIIIPKHVGFIVDGNRRRARHHGLPDYEGHLAGYNTVKEVLVATLEAGVEFASIYIFSTENWKRSKDEVAKLMGLVLRLLTSDLPEFEEKNIRLRILGSRHGLSVKIIKAMRLCSSKRCGQT